MAIIVVSELKEIEKGASPMTQVNMLVKCYTKVVTGVANEI